MNSAVTAADLATWGIAVLVTAGIILRPLNLPEAVWAVLGAAALVCCGVLPVSAAAEGVKKGLDVYLFLSGMMLLAELGRQEGLFDWLAARAAVTARGSAVRLFGLVYAVGIVVTVFLSNDATAVVLTPAVAAIVRTAKVEHPLPYLLVCAFIANAASFVLPISNPANLVIYANHMPPLVEWLSQFALPSVLSIAVTYAILRWTQRKALAQSVSHAVTLPVMTRTGRLTAAGICAAAVALMLASAWGIKLGLTTLSAGLVTLCAVTGVGRSSPWSFLRAVSWGVIPLVGGLFVMVEALDRSGVIHALSDSLRVQAQHSTSLAAAESGVIVGIVSNIVNNLPAGLIAGTAVHAVVLPASISAAILIGVDLGPNLSVTGSLATILWLTCLRRDGIEVKPWDFFKLGVLIMPPALLLSLGALLVRG